jgi:hypothetical protein
MTEEIVVQPEDIETPAPAPEVEDDELKPEVPKWHLPTKRQRRKMHALQGYTRDETSGA